MKYPVSDIREATRAKDTVTGKEVYLEEQLTDRFWIVSDLETGLFFLADKDCLVDLHYM